MRLNVSSEEDWAGAVETILAKRGRIDVLVKNAGISGAHAYHATKGAVRNMTRNAAMSSRAHDGRRKPFHQVSWRILKDCRTCRRIFKVHPYAKRNSRPQSDPRRVRSLRRRPRPQEPRP